MLLAFMLVAALQIKAQYVITRDNKKLYTNDSVILFLNNIRGEVHWQKSGDLIVWDSLAGETHDTLAIHVEHSAFYRAVIKEGTCAPLYSDTVLIAELYDDRDQQFYDVVKIGSQWWMSENLNYDAGNNSWFYYSNPLNGPVYGRLYNWNAASNSCPSGWHLPSDREWMILETFLGIDPDEVTKDEWRGTGLRVKLEPGGSTGFDLLYSGFRAPEEYFDGIDVLSLYWTSGADESGLHWYRGLNTTNTGIHRTSYADSYGFSVRCVKNNTPFLFSDSVSHITDTSVVAYGHLYDSQGSNVTSMGICWGVEPDPSYDDNFITVDINDTTFSAAVPYLSTGITYYLRAFAVNATGVGYGSNITFTTKSPIPVIITTAATSITTTSARSGGNIINSKGLQITSRGVCWSTDEHPTLSDAKTVNGSGTGSYVSNLTGLLPNTQYFVRAYVTTPAGDFYGNEISLKTSAVNETGSVTDARDGKNYRTVKIGFQWWMAENLDHYTATGSSYFGNDSIEYSEGGRLYNIQTAQNVCMSGWHLPSEDEWEVLEMTLGMDMAVLENTGWRGTDEGAKLFPGMPDGFDAEFAGLFTAGGEYFGYGTIATYWSSSEYGSSGTYWYRGINTERTDIHREKYGDPLMHSVRCVKNDKPVLVTDSVGNIGEFTAKAYSRILSNGGRNITARGVCWSKNPNPTLANAYTSDGTGNLPFISSITGLDQNTAYYLRAYATNDQGTAYGNEITFLTQKALPVVTTTSVSSITSTTAKSGGTVVDSKGFTITARGVCWSTVPVPTLANSYTTNGSGTGTFTSNINGLQPNTKYYVRAYATSGAGTGYGNEVTFRTSYQYPTGTYTDTRDGHVYITITIGEQLWMGENLTYNTPGSAFYDNSEDYSQYGRLYSWQAATEACPSSWHLPADSEWKTLEVYMGMDVSTADNSGWRGTNEGSKLVVGGTSGFEAAFGGQYYPGGYFGDEGVIGTYWTSTQTDGSNAWYRGFNITHEDIHRDSYLKTYKYSVRCLKNQLPVLTTTVVTGKSDTSAYSGGTITYDGGAPVTARGVCWGTAHNPTVSNDTTLDGTGEGSYVSFITGLEPAKTYYIRAYATNAEGTAYGEEVSVTTLSGVPKVTTSAVTSITDSSAASGGVVTSSGGLTVTMRGVCWSTIENPTTANDKTNNGTGTGTFTSQIVNLLPNTTYYVRAYATNSKGTGYGSQRSFKTSAAIPKVTTAAITGITDNSAIGGGSVTSDGGLTVTARGLCWSTSPNPDINDSKTQNGSGIGSYISYLNGLDDVTTYYVKAYATNSAGTAYGEEVHFTTTYVTGSLSDTRDGQIYATVKINDEWWMAENLNYRVPGSVNYYNNSDSVAYAETYGRLYTWNAMMNGDTSSVLVPSGAQGVCPTGWHIPSEAEWTALINYLGGASVAGNVMKEAGTAHWSSTSGSVTNSSGFTALPAGIVTDALASENIRLQTYFWSATEFNATRARRWIFTHDSGMVSTNTILKGNHVSVRCKEDLP